MGSSVVKHSLVSEWVVVHYNRDYVHNRRIKLARFPFQRTLDEFDLDFKPVVKKKDIHALATTAFAHQCRNVLFVGPPGVGKSHLAVALGINAIHNGYTVLYKSAFDLALELAENETPKQKREYTMQLARVNLLVIDELGMKKMPETAAEDLLEIIHRRHLKASTIIATNRIVSDWGQILGDTAATAAILDRFLENAITFTIRGKSYRIAQSNRKEQS